ncbi:helix-turn-helix domain-containing protein [Blastopirellula marina]|uniref:AlbA family DNA-binding domain-containing protein n=1 Tax=Blastopirellula marina TaxID=124 RepID=UPI001304D0D9|nr:ATP-binding protein [Blastopirellula marina]
METHLFERLLYEEESTTLDFKRDQYRFVKASDEDKSELLKDIIGFANAWRRSNAYILIGVDDVRGGKANVVGIPPDDHLNDHSLQQFVNNLTNRAVRFHYEAFGYEGMQVGIICIENQHRPIYLKHNYGKLKKGEVYVRRGSSTDPTKPADPDEIALMGNDGSTEAANVRLSIEFAEVSRNRPIGHELQLNAEYCTMPELESIPELSERSQYITLPNGQKFPILDMSSFDISTQLNPHYFVQLANYTFFERLVKRCRMVVSNTGEIAAEDVRIEIEIRTGEGIAVFDDSQVPSVPQQRENKFVPADFTNFKLRRSLRDPGYIDIEKDDEHFTIEVDCGDLQPGRHVWTSEFSIGVCESGEYQIRGRIFASNLPEPLEFTLSIKATIDQTQMSVDELLSLEAPAEE